MEDQKIQVLINQVLEGNEDAFKFIYNEAKGIVFSLCCKYHFQEWDLDDMKQEAQIILFQSIQKVVLPLGEEADLKKQFFAFYHTNLNHHFLNQLRKENTKKRKSNKEKIEFQEASPDLIHLLKEEDASYLATRMAVEEISDKYLTLEECQLISWRLEGIPIRTCSKLLKRGTNYTYKLIGNIRKVFHNSEIFEEYFR